MAAIIVRVSRAHRRELRPLWVNGSYIRNLPNTIRPMCPVNSANRFLKLLRAVVTFIRKIGCYKIYESIALMKGPFKNCAIKYYKFHLKFQKDIKLRFYNITFNCVHKITTMFIFFFST